MSRREAVTTELPHDVMQERVELHVLITRDAGIRCLAAGIRVDEAIHDLLPEHLRVIEGIERDA